MWHTIMLFRLPRDCSASCMFAVNNVMSCPALVRKLVFGFYKRVNSSLNCIVQAICGSDIWWKSSIRSNWHKLLYVHDAGQGRAYRLRVRHTSCGSIY